MITFESVGIDFYLSEFVIIKSPELIKIGNHVAIDQFVTITTQADIGDYVHIAPNCTIIGGKNSKVILDDHSGLAAGARIIAGGADFNSGYLTNPQVPKEFTKPVNSVVKFEKFSILSTNSVVMPGVTLGEGCVVGANSLVLEDTEPWTIYVGSPAKPIKIRNKGEIINFYKKLKK
jgi:acetyltransferase-like isoleucine patch superfamily enzyme